jgi:hypothetical protein
MASTRSRPAPHAHPQVYKARAGKTPGSAEHSAGWKSDGAKSKKQQRRRNREMTLMEIMEVIALVGGPQAPAAGRDCR